MGEFLDKQGLTRFKDKVLTEVDKRIASGGGGSSGDFPTREELIEATSRVTDVEVDVDNFTLDELRLAVDNVEANMVRSVNGTSADANGNVSITIPSDYTLPNATSSTLGGVKIGSNITVSSGTISLSKTNVTSALGYTPLQTAPVTSVNGKTGAVTGLVTSVNGTSADASGNVSITALSSTIIPANVDLNNYKTVGEYNCPATADAKTLSNCPIQSAFTLTVINGATFQQILRQYSGQSVWIRTYQDWNDTWTAWVCSGGLASVVTTWVSGKNWYRKWSNGWIEQGGYSSGGKSGTKTTLHLAFKDTNYNVNFQQITSDSYANTCYPTSMTTTNFVIYARITANFYWYACGY